MRTGFLFAAVAAALCAAWLLWRTEPVVAPVTPAPASATPAPESAQDPTHTAPAPPTTREQIGDEHPFVSESENNGVVTGPVRDGLTILVLGADRRPRAALPIDVRWRKGWGDYGHDRGTTGANGRFATTVAEPEMLEDVAVTHPAHGELRNWSAFLPMAYDPRTVLCIVPDLHPVTIRVVDERGVAVSSAIVETECDHLDAAHREYTLSPAHVEAATDRDGRAVLHLPAGTHRWKVKADGHDALYSLRAAVPPGGRSLTLHLLSTANRRNVAVTVIAPAEIRSVTVSGQTRKLPDLPSLEADGVEPVGIQCRVRQVGAREYVVAAPPMQWHCSAHAEGHWGSATVEAFATTATVELRVQPAKPMAKLRCKLLLPGGEETFGEVMVHTQPYLTSGQRYSVGRREAPIEVVPAGRVCVSAWRSEYAPAIVGPIDLVAGEQEIVLQLAHPSSIRGRVVDEAGSPVEASVNLLRPAGPLRALGEDVPAILPSSASGDSHTTHDDGVFRFERVGDGEHALWVVPKRTGWPARALVQPGDQDVVVRLGDGLADRARIHGRVTLATTGAPVPWASVSWQSGKKGASTYTDADGRYSVAAPVGELRVDVAVRRCARLAGDPESFTAALYTRDLVLSPCEPLFVSVRDEAGRVAVVDIFAFDANGRALSLLDRNGNDDGDYVTVDANGRAELGGLPHTTLRLRLETEDAKQSMHVEVPGSFRRDADFHVTWKPHAAPK